MKQKRIFSSNHKFSRIFLPVFLLGFGAIFSSAVCAQTPAEEPRPDPNVAVEAKIERARALAAAHHLRAAADELESVRATAKDDVLRTVSSVMLMSIHLEEGNYARAESLLEETFSARSGANDGSIRAYFALAGQAVNGARSHLARYRSFGINVADARLPLEAASDLDRLRSLLERMVAQAREITKDASKAYYSLALLEDVLGIRLSLARDGEDRAKWEGAYVVARQSLAASQNQIASLGRIPSLSSTIRGSSSSGPEASKNQSSESNNSDAAATSAPDQAGETSEPKTVNGGLLNERANKRVVPSYPPLARSSSIQGIVRVFVTIDESGKVVNVLRSEGHALLKPAAEEAAAQWVFPPTLVDNKPVRLTGYIDFNFTL